MQKFFSEEKSDFTQANDIKYDGIELIRTSFDSDEFAPHPKFTLYKNGKEIGSSGAWCTDNPNDRPIEHHRPEVQFIIQTLGKDKIDAIHDELKAAETLSQEELLIKYSDSCPDIDAEIARRDERIPFNLAVERKMRLRISADLPSDTIAQKMGAPSPDPLSTKDFKGFPRIPDRLWGNPKLSS